MKQIDFLKTSFIAHRGLFYKEKGIEENTLEAFSLAIRKGYAIEFHVHLLKDNSIVVFHDDSLKRMTGMDKKIKDCIYEEIKTLKLGNSNSTIPLLTEVLTLVAGKVPLVIELKSDRKIGMLEPKLWEVLKEYKGEYAIESFHPLIVNWFKNQVPFVVRGQLSSNFKNDKSMTFIRKWFLKNMVLNFITKPNFIAYDIHSLPNKKVRNFRKKGGLVIGWTVKTKKEYEKAKKYCDNLICENII